jgi:citronellyl-CoA dehydrogenase
MARESSEQLYFNEDHRLLRSSLKKFIEGEINPYVDEWEQLGTPPLHELFKKMGDLGFLGIKYDPKYGGQGLDYWHETVFLEELGHIKALGMAMAIAVQTNMCTPQIAEFGSEYLKEKYLKGAIAGDLVGAIAVTEPGAGSDVSALRMTAKKNGDSYILNGSKLFITNGTQSDWFTLLARTAEGSGYGVFSMFVVPSDLPGITISKKLDKVGLRISDTAELFFDEVELPAKNLIGEEGQGFFVQMRAFQHERFSVIPFSYIAALDMIDLTVEYIRGRVVFGKPLIAKQVLRHRLADWNTEIECLRQLAYHIVRLKVAGIDATLEISMAKLKAGQVINQIADGCLQMHGGMGFMNETIISRYWRDARCLSIGGGADEVMREVISKLEGY